MMALFATIWLGFQVLATSVLYGMVEMGFHPGQAVAIAVVVAVAGAMITRAMYRKTYNVETNGKEHPGKAARSS